MTRDGEQDESCDKTTPICAQPTALANNPEDDRRRCHARAEPAMPEESVGFFLSTREQPATHDTGHGRRNGEQKDDTVRNGEVFPVGTQCEQFKHAEQREEADR